MIMGFEWYIWAIFISLLICAFCIPKWRLANKITISIKRLKLKNDIRKRTPKITIIESILNFVPFVNSIKIEKLINGSAGFYNIVAMIELIVWPLCLTLRFLFQREQMINIIITFTIFILILLAYVTEVKQTFDIMTMINERTFWKVLFCFICPPVVHYVLSYRVERYFVLKTNKILQTFNGSQNTNIQKEDIDIKE